MKNIQMVSNDEYQCTSALAFDDFIPIITLHYVHFFKLLSEHDLRRMWHESLIVEVRIAWQIGNRVGGNFNTHV